MGLIDKLKNNYDYFKADKFTKRRLSQSQFEAHNRQYYEQIYRNGNYMDTGDMNIHSTSREHLHYRNSRWSLQDYFFNKKPHKKPLNQMTTSEAYTLGYTRD